MPGCEHNNPKSFKEAGRTEDGRPRMICPQCMTFMGYGLSTEQQAKAAKKKDRAAAFKPASEDDGEVIEQQTLGEME